MGRGVATRSGRREVVGGDHRGRAPLDRLRAAAGAARRDRRRRHREPRSGDRAVPRRAHAGAGLVCVDAGSPVGSEARGSSARARGADGDPGRPRRLGLRSLLPADRRPADGVVGYEALSRFTDGIPPDVRFATADRAGLGIELEVATMRAALEAAANLPTDVYLSLNASPALITSGELRALLRGCTRAIVLEITEHVVIDDYPALRASLASLVPSVRLAVDDAGAGYASLRHILELAPDFVKLDVGLVRGIDTDPARQALLAGMGYFAVKRRIRLVAEGIETEAELESLRALGISHGQGYLLGRPQDGRGAGPWSSTAAPRTDR
ncbi:MAG: EAL domain-containing protein [Candidatus Limnocylindrales bacterium]